MTSRILDPVKNKKEWDELVSPINDIYYSSDFLWLSQINFNNIPKLFFYQDEGGRVIYPIILRHINNIPALRFEEGYDSISSELSGPAVIGKPNIQFFLNEFHNYCVENRIVTEIVRFNPVLKNYVHFKDARKLKELVYVNLTQPQEQIFKNLKKECRKAIRKAEKNDIKIVISNEPDNIRRFYELYVHTMIRRNATDENFISLKFFSNLFEILKDKITLFLALYKEKPIVGSTLIHQGDIAYEYFRGALNEFFNLRGNNLIIWNKILWAKKQGYKTYIMGSGYRPNDELFRFKTTFSNTTFDYFRYKKIHDQELYNKLCKLRDEYSLVKTKDYFPYYRAGLI